MDMIASDSSSLAHSVSEGSSSDIGASFSPLSADPIFSPDSCWSSEIYWTKQNYFYLSHKFRFNILLEIGTKDSSRKTSSKNVCCFQLENWIIYQINDFFSLYWKFLLKWFQNVFSRNTKIHVFLYRLHY